MNHFALQARCELALARVAHPLDSALAARHHERALALAADAAWVRPIALLGPPLLLADEPELLDTFHLELACVEQYHAEERPIYWQGTWSVSLDGEWEALPLVVRDDDQYLPALLESHRGGDGTPTYGDPEPSLRAAIRAARSLASRWDRG